MEGNNSHSSANPASHSTDFGMRQIHAHTHKFCSCVLLQPGGETTCRRNDWFPYRIESACYLVLIVTQSNCFINQVLSKLENCYDLSALRMVSSQDKMESQTTHYKRQKLKEQINTNLSCKHNLKINREIQ